jgi:hypothetical protein
VLTPEYGGNDDERDSEETKTGPDRGKEEDVRSPFGHA